MHKTPQGPANTRQPLMRRAPSKHAPRKSLALGPQKGNLLKSWLCTIWREGSSDWPSQESHTRRRLSMHVLSSLVPLTGEK